MIHNRAAFLAIITLFVGPLATASERPSSTAKPLSEIAAAVEQAGFTPIVEASFESGRWEIEAYQADIKYDLRVDPATGQIKSKRVDD